ncbi:MAG: hypothetical protein PHH22_03690 [Clostridia bacterium]|nr:hypothetical protein [Clostridia bacterium]
MDKLGNVLSNLITIIVWFVIISAISFAMYVYLSPEVVTFNEKSYEKIAQEAYEVKDEAIDDSLLSAKLLTIDKNDLKRYEDLKDYYKGRNDPFTNLNGYREDVLTDIDNTGNIDNENNDENNDENETPIE